jgi:Divergent InlB B-repeat domain
VTSNHTISATFAANAAGTFSITPGAGANGSISPATAQTVSSGGNATFNMLPASGFQVADVLVDGVPVGAVSSYTFTGVASNHTISVTFMACSAATTFTITPTAGANGSISPATAQTVVSGASATFAITAATGFHIQDVLVDGSSVGASSTVVFANVTANHTISATFAANTGGVAVPTHTTINRNRYIVRRGHDLLRLTGTCTPVTASRGGHVRISVRKPGSHVYVTLSIRNVNVNGQYFYSFHPSRRKYHAGIARFRAQLLGRTGINLASSAFINVRLR